jgi:L-ascorbate metabolism protein UlaG (beta-lactamase superfamily)
MEAVRVRYLGGPTALLELGGIRLLLDPTFDPPGDYPIGERILTKTQGPACGPAELGRVDAILLSHDQHPDNLDRLGRQYLMSGSVAFSTTAAYGRIGDPVHPLRAWERAELSGAGTSRVLITSVPARHGPEGSEPLVGAVTGFVVSGPGLARIYVSGDNASLDLVRAIADRIGSVDVALLFAGAAQTTLISDAFLTLTSEDAAEAVRILGSPETVPLHYEGWAHYTEGADALRRAFQNAGLTEHLRVLKRGEQIEFRPIRADDHDYRTPI